MIIKPSTCLRNEYNEISAICKNENGFVKVAKYENGSLFLEGAYIPTWLLQFKSFLHNIEQEETNELEQ